MPDSTWGQWKGVRQDEPVGSWSLELPHSSLLPVGPCCWRGQWLPGVTEKDQPSTVSWANACAWNRRPLGQIPAFPSEQGAVSLVAASHIYIMAAAHRKGSGLGSEPFMKAACSLLHHHTSIHMRALTVRSPACPSQGSWLLWPVQRCPQHTHDPYEKPSGIHCCTVPFWAEQTTDRQGDATVVRVYGIALCPSAVVELLHRWYWTWPGENHVSFLFS